MINGSVRASSQSQPPPSSQSPVPTHTRSLSPDYWSLAPALTNQVSYITTLTSPSLSLPGLPFTTPNSAQTQFALFQTPSDRWAFLLYSWFQLSIDPATKHSHQYTAKIHWTDFISKTLTCHLLLKICFHSGNKPACCFTQLLFPSPFVTGSLRIWSVVSLICF